MARMERDQYGQHRDNIPDGLRYNQTAHTFTVGEHAYRCQPLDPLQQIHTARRLAPIILSALKPEDGRQAILARLMKLASLAASEADKGDAEPATSSEAVVNDALDLATSIFSGAAAADEETVNKVIRLCGQKIWRIREGGAGQPIWHSNSDLPTYRDLDGFQILSLVCRYLFLEFRESIGDYIRGLGLKPGPVLTAAGKSPAERPPGAPGII